MNILIPHNWLLEHLDTQATPQEIQKYVSLCGPSIERIYDREGESVYDIEVTTNRVDSMSVRGIAREAAVILQQFGIKAKLKKFPYQQLVGNKLPVSKAESLALPQILDDHKLCGRILTLVLRDVQHAATPDWMAKRLLQIDQHVHDAVIDITNYITHELGHPCHAFDYDKVMALGGMFIVDQARAGKKFVTLDGEEYKTVGGEVVFENEKGEIIDLPGIKGTANTSISDDTKNVLFWLENIDAKKIRFASMSHAIRTVAAQLNEKHVDPELAADVLSGGVALFQKLCDAKIASQIVDKYPAKRKHASVKVSLARITEYLGIELPVNKIAKILEDLGCEVELSGSSKTGPSLQVTPPSFRPDIEIPADVIEEIARIYGYHNLPSVLMPTAIPLTKPRDTDFQLENRVKRFLAAIGWQEVYTYSMVSAELATQSGYALADHLKLQNPLTDDRVYLRRSLTPSLEEIVNNNQAQKLNDVFEIANVYHPKAGQLPEQVLQLTLVSTREYSQVRGDIEALLAQFFLKNVKVDPVKDEPANAVVSQQAALIVTDENTLEHFLGAIGILDNGHVSITIDIRQLLEIARKYPIYQPLPKTNEIVEDMTFTLPPRTEVGPIMAAIRVSSDLISNLEITSIYQQNFTFRVTYHNPEETLSVTTIEPLRQAILKLVTKKFAGQLVGQISNRV
jgi:phenylalanyl-tRNA synthetase beta chain